MSVTEMTVDEMTESLTGFDEIAIRQNMGLDVYVDGEAQPMGLMRSLVFVHKRRPEGGGLTDPQAKTAALGMTVRDVTNYFAQAPEELDPEGDPDTPSGNGVSEPAATPNGSPTSV